MSPCATVAPRARSNDTTTTTPGAIMAAVTVHLHVPCPACEGDGEILVAGDPRGPAADIRTCWGCKGETTVTSERADEIRAAEWDGP